MAEVLGVNVTKFDSPGDANWISQGLIKSSLRVWSDTFEASAQPANDTIVIARLPVGAIVYNILLSHDALGAATFDIGDSTDVDRYVDGVSVSAIASSFTILPDGMLYEIGTNTDDGGIQITILGAAITGTVKTAVFYTN